MRLVFAGTPAFSVTALQALFDAGHDIAGVYTQPDRPAGRGRHLSASPVAERAQTLGLPVFKPAKLRDNPEALAELAALQPRCMVVVAYGLILPQAVLDIPPLGCLNIHASLLPRWRGAAPIQRAILAGDLQTGITIMQMDAGLDTGPMLLQQSVPIGPDTTAATLHDTLSACGAALIVEALRALEGGTLTARPQPAEGVTYASKLVKEEARLDWTRPARDLQRQIHGYNPAPGAWCEQGAERIKLLRARVAEGAPPPAAQVGEVLAVEGESWQVACGEGLLLIDELQRPGGKPASPARAWGGRSALGTVLH